MADIDWQPLPPLWPSPAVWADVRGLMLLIFTQDNVPRWEVRRKGEKVHSVGGDLNAGGSADTFEAAKAARSSRRRCGLQNNDIALRGHDKIGATAYANLDET